jgi:4-hydroxybenzoate polyprenyltransferase
MADSLSLASRLRAYAQLMRLAHPVGSWLLMWPGLWAALLASQYHGAALPWQALATIALGAVLMRSAGCVVNDLTDAELDKHVERTRTRPIAAGIVSKREATLLALLLTALAGLLILPFGLNATLTAIAALPLVIAYPWMKRITWWPQAFLGLTFNWGAILGWVMVADTIAWPALALYAGGIAWTIGYDTIYAHQDREDDALIGIRSTARLFGTRTWLACAICFTITLLCWALALSSLPFSLQHAVGILAIAAFFLWQLRALDISQPALCGLLFRAHSLVGWLLLLAIC